MRIQEREEKVEKRWQENSERVQHEHDGESVMADFTPTQGRYLAFIHQVQVERIEQAIPTVTYPRVIKRVGKSPPQYGDE